MPDPYRDGPIKALAKIEAKNHYLEEINEGLHRVISWHWSEDQQNKEATEKAFFAGLILGGIGTSCMLLMLIGP